MWFSPNGIANIMSIDSLAKYYRVRMDTDKDDAITVHMGNGAIMHFAPSPNGLYWHIITGAGNAGPEWVMLQMVKKNAKG